MEGEEERKSQFYRHSLILSGSVSFNIQLRPVVSEPAMKCSPGQKNSHKILLYCSPHLINALFSALTSVSSLPIRGRCLPSWLFCSFWISSCSHRGWHIRRLSPYHNIYLLFLLKSMEFATGRRMQQASPSWPEQKEKM